ncbi:MAG: hypothetical protein AAFV90_24085 [Cyanobacteria bacterium J06634_5]
MILNQLALPATQDKYRALLDSDILLELLHNRSPFVEDAELLLEQLGKRDSIELYITDRTLRRIIAEHEDISHAIQVAGYFREVFAGKILHVSDSLLSKAKKTGLPDFESSIEIVCTEEYELNAIITNNPSNYPDTIIPIWSVSNLEKRTTLEEYLSLSVLEELLHSHPSGLENDNKFESEDTREKTEFSEAESYLIESKKRRLNLVVKKAKIKTSLSTNSFSRSLNIDIENVNIDIDRAIELYKQQELSPSKYLILLLLPLAESLMTCSQKP